MKTKLTESSIAQEVIDAIAEVIGSGPAALHEPSFHGNELAYLKECIDSNYVSSIGKFVDRFEVDLADFTGAKHAVAIVNGTAALHIALKLAGVQTGDEVLIPALTFVATANAVTYCNATPHFVESEDEHLGIDPIELREYLDRNTEQYSGKCVNKNTGNIIRALVPMHTFGHPSDLEGLLSVARDFNLILVEDAAESLGSYYQGQHTGTFGLLGALSFNGNKTITTGGGGAIITDNASLAKHAKHLTTTAKLPHAWEFQHDEIGYNYRMPNLNAALGCAQLEQLPTKLLAKRDLYDRYKKSFETVQGLKLFCEPKSSQSNYWLQTLLLDENQIGQKYAILKSTNEVGYMTRPAWTLMNELKQFANSPSMHLTVAKSLSERLINIPSSSSLVETNA
jgi:aminotransferase in exopolysaccharide biosynthesis